MLNVPSLGEWRIKSGYIAPIDKLEGAFYNRTITKPRTSRASLDPKASADLEHALFDMMDGYYYAIDFASRGRCSAVTEEESPWR